MDALELKLFKPRLSLHMAIQTLQPQKAQDPKDQFEEARKASEFALAGDKREAAAAQPTAAHANAETFAAEQVFALAPEPDASEDEGMSDEARVSALLGDVPDEIMAAARQIIKSQMKSRLEPGKGLKMQQKAERFPQISEPEMLASVLDVIMDSAPPIPCFEEFEEAELPAA